MKSSEVSASDILKKLKRQGDDWTGVRLHQEKVDYRSFRDGQRDRQVLSSASGVMLEVMVGGFLGYAATSDLSQSSLQNCYQRAFAMARLGQSHPISLFTHGIRPAERGQYRSPREKAYDSQTWAEAQDALREACLRMGKVSGIMSSSAALMVTEVDIRLACSAGRQIEQSTLLSGTSLSATAMNQGETQTRSDQGGFARCYQGGAELIARDSLLGRAEKAAEQARELVFAENCPSETCDILIMPDQMMLQIHESIGHPLELDRILGDERNYAGWSFVRPEDFGHLQYGSELLNVVFDPHQEGEFASYAYDETGNKATKEYLIKRGKLLRGLGGLESQSRLECSGVACTRSSGWNRPPIDRMANINIEAGEHSLDEMIQSMQRGVVFFSNRSWSIDDYRNKFQFGSEYAQLVEEGRVTKTLKNPNYRGSSLPFWQSLKMVGNQETVETYGTPFCGKGEPNQVIRVGHASPPCLFEQVEVFGGLS